MREFRFALLVAIMVIATMLPVYATLIRPWHMRWGATIEEVTRALLGMGTAAAIK